MSSYQIEITETLVRIVDIEANSAEDAIAKAKEKYNNSEIVLDSNDLWNQADFKVLD